MVYKDPWVAGASVRKCTRMRVWNSCTGDSRHAKLMYWITDGRRVPRQQRRQRSFSKRVEKKEKSKIKLDKNP